MVRVPVPALEWMKTSSGRPGVNERRKLETATWRRDEGLTSIDLRLNAMVNPQLSSFLLGPSCLQAALTAGTKVCQSFFDLHRKTGGYQ